MDCLTGLWRARARGIQCIPSHFGSVYDYVCCDRRGVAARLFPLSRTDAISLLTLVWADRMKFPIACLLVSTVLLCRHVGVVLAQCGPINDECTGAFFIAPGTTFRGASTRGAAAETADIAPCTGTVSSKSQPREQFPPVRSHVTDVFATWNTR
jgi:hypothetical protein